jgi:hypothetical protein
MALALMLLAEPAQARPHIYARVKCAGTYCQIVTAPEPDQDGRPAIWRNGSTKRERARPFPSGRPHAWCGWWMRRQVGRDPGAIFNLARAWAHWGHAASPAPGVVVVWPHHVGLITGRDANGNWIIKSGNDAHAVRERARSVSGAIAFRRG